MTLLLQVAHLAWVPFMSKALGQMVDMSCFCLSPTHFSVHGICPMPLAQATIDHLDAFNPQASSCLTTSANLDAMANACLLETLFFLLVSRLTSSTSLVSVAICVLTTARFTPPEFQISTPCHFLDVSAWRSHRLAKLRTLTTQPIIFPQPLGPILVNGTTIQSVT